MFIIKRKLSLFDKLLKKFDKCVIVKDFELLFKSSRQSKLVKEKKNDKSQ